MMRGGISRKRKIGGTHTIPCTQATETPHGTWKQSWTELLMHIAIRETCVVGLKEKCMLETAAEALWSHDPDFQKFVKIVEEKEGSRNDTLGNSNCSEARMKIPRAAVVSETRVRASSLQFRIRKTVKGNPQGSGGADDTGEHRDAGEGAAPTAAAVAAEPSGTALNEEDKARSIPLLQRFQGKPPQVPIPLPNRTNDDRSMVTNDGADDMLDASDPQ